MPPRKRAAAKTTEVDQTVVNQENPGSSEEERETTETESSAKVVGTAPANEVDETVRNQMNPGTSTVERESTDTPAEPGEVNKNIAPTLPVDEVVENQMNPGINMVDRQPDPVILEDSAGIKYDVSKSYPELIQEKDAPEEQARRARMRQQEAVLDAKKIGEEVDTGKDYIVLEFVETGLTAQGHVWKKGEVLRMEDTDENRSSNADTNGDVWYELSSAEQEKRFGHVKFERR